MGASLSDTSPESGFGSVLQFGRTLRLVWGIAPRWTLATLVLAVVQGVLPLLGLLLLREIVDAVVAGVTAPDKTAAFAAVAWWIAAAALVGLLTALARSVALLVGEAHAVVVTDHMSDLIHAKSVVVDLEYYEDARYYDVLHRAQQEAPYRPTRMVGDLMLAGQSLVTLVGIVGVLFAIHWSVALIIAAAALPSAYVRLRHSGRLYEWQRRRTAAERRSSYLHWLLTDGAHAKEVRIFGLGEPLRGWYRDLREDLRAERLGIARRRAAADLGSQAVATAAVFGTFAYIAWRAVQGLITLGDLMMYYQALQTGLGALQGLLGAHGRPPRARPLPDLVPRVHGARGEGGRAGAAGGRGAAAPAGHRLRGRELRLPRQRPHGARARRPDDPAGRGHRPGRAQRLRQDDTRQAAVPALRPAGRPGDA